MGGMCCSARDRNDKVTGIEARNNMWFYFNYPLFIDNIKTRMNQFEDDSKILTSTDFTYFKYALSQLETEIEQNKRNLAFESKQRYRKRVMLEICKGHNFVKTGRHGIVGGGCKSLVRA